MIFGSPAEYGTESDSIRLAVELVFGVVALYGLFVLPFQLIVLRLGMVECSSVEVQGSDAMRKVCVCGRVCGSEEEYTEHVSACELAQQRLAEDADDAAVEDGDG